MLPRRRMLGFGWQLLILGTTLMTTIECSRNSDATNMDDELKNIDEMFAMESKRFLQAIPYKTGAPSSSKSISLSASQKTELLKEIYRKTAGEFWNINNNNNSPSLDSDQSNSDLNDDAQSTNQHYVTMPVHPSYAPPSYLQAQPQVQPKILPSYGQLLQPRTDYYTTAFNQGYLKGKDIHIQPEHKPITLHYRTHAQPIIVHQQRLPGPKPEVKHTKSQEEPQRVVHEVIRPIIQEVHEIIQPYRRVVQQVQPVIEEVRTIIAKDSGAGKLAQPSPIHQDLDAPLLINNGHVTNNGPGPGYHSGFMKTNQIYHASASNELPRNNAMFVPRTAAKRFRKAPVFENNEDDMIPMMTTNNGQRFIRSRVYLTPKGIPVYQSNYRAPIYLSA